MTVLGGPLKGYKWSTGNNYNYITGDYEAQDTMRTFRSWIKADTVLYDLGANVGYYAFIANLDISTGQVYSFEPMPLNIQTFKKHLELNKDKMQHQSITLLPYAVSDKEKEVVFSNNEKTIEGNTYIDSALHSSSSKDLIVKSYSIDNLLEQGYKKPDVLKIDVEGAEYDVLKGAEKTLKAYKPNILLGTHDCHLPGVQKHCVDFLLSIGYDVIPIPGHDKSMPGLDDYFAIHKDNK